MSFRVPPRKRDEKSRFCMGGLLRFLPSVEMTEKHVFQYSDTASQGGGKGWGGKEMQTGEGIVVVGKPRRRILSVSGK